MDTFKANGAEFLAQHDMIVAWCRHHKKQFEPVTTAWIFDVLAERPAGEFVDVGAATGWFAIPAALRGRSVTAVEANHRVFQRLRENAQHNGVPLSAYNVAASDRSGHAKFMYNHRLPLTSGGSLERPSSVKYETEVVPLVPLDNLVSGEVALMKIDVEGHEMAVLRGASRIIAESRPHLVLEANTQVHVDQLAGWATENGYTVQHADERNMLCRPSS